MAKSHSQPVNLPGAWPLMNPLPCVGQHPPFGPISRPCLGQETKYTLSGLKVYFWLWRTCATWCKLLGAQFQILGALTPKEYITLQKERLRLFVAIWAYSSSIKHNKNK